MPHASIGAEITGDLRMHFRRKTGGGDAPSGWWIVPEPELHLFTPGFTHVLSPDIAGWKRERMPVIPRSAFVSLVPDWVCEILSPSTANYDRRTKARIYHQAGVTWRWLVDPNAQTIEAYRRDGDFWVLLGTWGDAELACIEPFDTIELNLGLWWDGIAPLGEEMP
jgi:Uma2 family endonuclease